MTVTIDAAAPRVLGHAAGQGGMIGRGQVIEPWLTDSWIQAP